MYKLLPNAQQTHITSHKKTTHKKMHHLDEYTKEADLKNHAQRELANGRIKDPMDKLRLQCFSRGAAGIVGLARAFRVMDHDGSQTLSLEEFKKGIIHIGLDIDNEDIEEIFHRFDIDGNGTINMNEFLVKLRPPMNASRLDSMIKAFKKLDRNDDGHITMTDLKRVYSVGNNPLYRSGELSESDILVSFVKNFEAGAHNPEALISKDDFINYYATISASIDNDAYFDLVMRRAYNL
ncbi:hypothetical protein ACLKA7_009565 [Drosophila subpalustris]